MLNRKIGPRYEQVGHRKRFYLTHSNRNAVKTTPRFFLTCQNDKKYPRVWKHALLARPQKQCWYGINWYNPCGGQPGKNLFKLEMYI